MTPTEIILQLSKNQLVFEKLLSNIQQKQSLWKPDTNKWCMLEVVCHLVDEEIYDFRTRVKSILENPQVELPKFNPLDWAVEHRYMEQFMEKKTKEFLAERGRSVQWLKDLLNPRWKNEYHHPKMGILTAEYFLANWLAHDYIHLRQLNRLSYEFLQFESGINLNYAGDW